MSRQLTARFPAAEQDPWRVFGSRPVREWKVTPGAVAATRGGGDDEGRGAVEVLAFHGVW
jgi:hypothetical protein